MLPSELSDKIIDCLASKRKALASCSLVCRSWVARSRHHLWQEIVFYGRRDHNRLLRFVHFLHRSPDLASRILRFTLSSYSEPYGGYPEYPRGILKPLLEALPALETFKLDYVHLKLAHTTNIDLSSSVKTLCITNTEFEDILQFHHFMCAFPEMDDLAVGPGVSWKKWKDTDVIGECALVIDRLQVGFDDFVEGPVSWLALLYSLKTLTLCLKSMPWYICHATERWISAWSECIPAVESLELDLRHFEGEEWNIGPLLDINDAHAIDLSKATSLRDVTATVDTHVYAATQVSALLHDLLPTCPQDVRLDSCTILVMPYDDDCVRYGDEDDEDEEDAPDSQEIGKAWADRYDSAECPSFASVRIPSEFLTMRLIHPLRWDEHLYESIRAIWSAGVPLRLEHTTADGAVHTYIPPKDNELQSPSAR